MDGGAPRCRPLPASGSIGWSRVPVAAVVGRFFVPRRRRVEKHGQDGYLFGILNQTGAGNGQQLSDLRFMRAVRAAGRFSEPRRFAALLPVLVSGTVGRRPIEGRRTGIATAGGTRNFAGTRRRRRSGRLTAFVGRQRCGGHRRLGWRGRGLAQPQLRQQHAGEHQAAAQQPAAG